MSPRFVEEKEAAFLALMARRILNRRREAATRNENYQDVSNLVPISCGVRVKLRFVETGSGYTAEVDVMPDVRYSDEELIQIASEIIGYPVEEITFTTTDDFKLKPRVYRRKSL